MSSPGEAQPAKRRPGRPRKSPPSESVTQLGEPEPVDVVEAVQVGPTDDRIGEHVDDPRWRSISYPDGRQYRVENGIVVELVNSN